LGAHGDADLVKAKGVHAGEHLPDLVGLALAGWAVEVDVAVNDQGRSLLRGGFGLSGRITFLSDIDKTPQLVYTRIGMKYGVWSMREVCRGMDRPGR
jgi:hypothetical protein